MTAPIKVFICYKKMLSRERDGKTIEQENARAGILHYILLQDKGRFAPWIDDSELRAGMAWETEIYRRILVSDVLLLLIGPGTSKSAWVRREIALATALGIAIVPVAYDLNKSELDEELRSLDVSHLQAKTTQNIKLTAPDALLSELRPDLESAYLQTIQKQKETLSDLLARRNALMPKADDDQRAASFALSVGNNTLKLHVSGGDMSKVRDIDVLVNSENDYMQMARFFEKRTVSSMLRRAGSRVREGKYEDTIQHELDWQLRSRGRPVQVAEVFVTSAGGPGSDLARVNKVHYIFHVSAVQAVDAEGIVIPFKQPYQIESCTRACLFKLLELNRLNGVVSPPDTEQRAEQEMRAAQGRGIARSILFPLFGTGQGGNAADNVIGPMLTGITGFLEDRDNGELAATLSEIYISAFKQQDLDDVVRVLSAELPVASSSG